MTPLNSATNSLSFNWDTQQTQILEGLKNLAFEKEDDILLTDVTLACDGEYVQAHKLVLSLCSSFFRDLFRKNRADKSNTIIILGNVTSRILRYLLQFMYNGRVDILKEDVDSFLQAGKLLKIEGLVENEMAGSKTSNPVQNQSQSSSSNSSTGSLPSSTSSKRIAGSMATANNNDKITIHVYKKRRINEQSTNGSCKPVKISSQKNNSVIQNQPSGPVDPLLDLDGTGEMESDTEESPVFKSEMMEGECGEDDDSHEESDEEEPNSATPFASDSGPTSGPCTSSSAGGARPKASLSEYQRRKLRIHSTTRKDISKLYCMMNSMHAMLCQMNGGSAPITPQLPVNLPLSSPDEFETLNNWLKEIKNRATLVSKLGSTASGDVSVVTIEIMRRIIVPGSGLDEHLSYSNMSNSTNNVFMKKTNVHFAILDSVRASSGTSVSEKDINKCIRNYCNGRKQRVYGKKPRHIEVSEDEES